MFTISRRRLLQSGAAAAGLAATGWTLPARAKAPAGSYVRRSELPVLELDVAASAKRTRPVTKGQNWDTMPTGAIIMVPAGITIPAAWWRFNLRKNGTMADGSRVIISGEDRVRRPKWEAPQNQGVFALGNRSPSRVSLELENVEVKAGKGGNAVHVLNTDRVRLDNVLISGGKNGLFVPTHPTDIEIIDCEMMHCGTGSGLSHNLYVSYINNLTIRNTRFHSAKSQGHAFKAYPKLVDVRGCEFTHYDTDADLEAGFYGDLPLFDRGAWGSTIAMDNTFTRRGPVRPIIIDIRNRGYPPGYNKYVPEGWGTQTVDYHDVDNRDPSNPHLFRHLFFRNTVRNGILPDGGLDRLIQAKPGAMVRNNGSAPWAVQVKGKGGDGGPPGDWRPHHERAVVYLSQNTLEGVPFQQVARRSPFRRPGIETPVREIDGVPDWAADWVRT